MEASGHAQLSADWAADTGHSAADPAGVIVLAACAVWSLVTAAASGGRPEGMLLAVLAVLAGYAGGRVTGALLPVAAPAAGALAGTALVLAAPHSDRLPDTPPQLGGAAGTAAVLTLSAGAACCAAGAAVRAPVRTALRAVAVAITAIAALLGSAAGVVGCVAVLGCACVTGRVRRSRELTALGAGAGLAAAGTWAVAAGVLPGGLAGRVLSGHRLLLWRDAFGLTVHHPGLGAGPGRFGELSPTLAQTLTSDGRPHSALLQQAAEQGLVGAVLLGAGYYWLLLALWHSPRPTPVVLTAGTALTVLATLALAGNALSFTTVTAGAGLVAGFATARPLGYEPAADSVADRPAGGGGRAGPGGRD